MKNTDFSIDNIKNPLIKIKYYIQNLEDFNKEDEKIFEEEKYYSWSLKMKYATFLAKIKDKENEKLNINKAIRYYEEVIEILKDFQDDIVIQLILYKFIFKTLQKNENLNGKKGETKIEAQNRRKKEMLQIIIDIIKENIKILNKFNEESNEINYIETSEILTLTQICEKNLKLTKKRK